MTWSRASELHRALKCPASCVLPRPPRAERGVSAAAVGTALHAWAAGTIAHDWRTQDLPRPWTDGEGDVLLALDCDAPSSPGLVFTGPVDTRTAVRDGLGDSYLAGEADRAAWTDGHVTVRDLKTGWHPGDPARLDQVRFYALALCRAVGARQATVAIDWFPAAEPGHPVLAAEGTVARDDLEAWWDGAVIPAYRLVREARDVAGYLNERHKLHGGRPGDAPRSVPGYTNPGPHCSFCPCTGCPEHYDNNQGDIE